MLKRILGFGHSPASAEQVVGTAVKAAGTSTTVSIGSKPKKQSRPKRTNPVEIKTRKLMPKSIFDKLIDRSREWRLYDIERIVRSVGVRVPTITVQGMGPAPETTKTVSIWDVIREFHCYRMATTVKVEFYGGPGAGRKINSNLSHWLLDQLMWEVRLDGRKLALICKELGENCP